MNEKIKDLAKQAGLKQRIWNSLGKELPMWQEDPDNPGLEKFAELIIRECMDMVIEHEDDAPEEFHKLWLHIKEHFGIE